MHAASAAGLEGVGRLTVVDSDGALARRVADSVGAGVGTSVEALLRSGVDGLLIAAATPAHPDLIRTATNLLPPDLEVVRIVDIVGLDTQADGGTHVASTAQIGRIEVVKVESKGKGFRRLRVRLVD